MTDSRGKWPPEARIPEKMAKKTTISRFFRGFVRFSGCNSAENDFNHQVHFNGRAKFHPPNMHGGLYHGESCEEVTDEN